MDTLIEKAKIDAFNTIQMHIQRGYSEYSQIHRCSNECLTQICKLLDIHEKKILSVCGSGDNYLSFLLNGAKDVVNFDINGLTEYYLILKIIAVLILNPDEFKEFFIFGKDKMKGSTFGRTGFFDEKLYSKIQSYLPKNIRIYWDILYRNIPEDIQSDTMKVFKIHYISSIIENIPYLDNENYSKLRGILEKRKSHSFHKLDVFDIAELLNDKYNLIYLSNVAYFIDDWDRWIKYCLIDLKTILAENGRIMSYYNVKKDDNSMELISSGFDEGIISVTNGEHYIYTCNKNGNEIKKHIISR